jgi:hypothetical protein
VVIYTRFLRPKILICRSEHQRTKLSCIIIQDEQTLQRLGYPM